MTSAKRPWQGTTLAVFAIIATVVLFLGGLMALFAQSMVGGFFGGIDTGLADIDPSMTTEFTTGLSDALEKEGVEINISDKELAAFGDALEGGAIGGLGGMLAGMFTVMGIVLLGLSVLYIFISRGLLAGVRWALITDLVFIVLAALGGLGNLANGQGYVGLAIQVFLLVIAVQMLKDPYYKAKKA